MARNFLTPTESPQDIPWSQCENGSDGCKTCPRVDNNRRLSGHSMKDESSLEEELKEMRFKISKMEAMLQEKLNLAFDCEEQHHTEKVQAMEHGDHIIQQQIPFSLEKHIQYVDSESWCLPKFRPIWTEFKGEHTLVISVNTGLSKVGYDIDQETAAIVRVDQANDDRDRGVLMDRLAIVCPTLLAEIARISGAGLTVSRNVLLPPYKILVPFHDRFAARLTECEARCQQLKGQLDPDKLLEAKHLQQVANGMICLLTFLRKHWSQSLGVCKRLEDKSLKEISFDRLWYLFKSGDIIVSVKPKLQAYRVLYAGGGRVFRNSTDDRGNPNPGATTSVSDFFIDCYSIDFNGTHYGAVPHVFKISPYEGLRKITSLEVAPIKFFPASEEIEAYLQKRGEKFVDLARVCHKKYKGQTLKEGSFRSEEIDGDAIIDFVLSFKNRSNAPDEFAAPSFGGGIIDAPTLPDKRETEELYQGCPVVGHCQKYYTYEDTLPDLARREELLKLPNINLGATIPENFSDHHEYILLPYRVYGYVLLRRQWYPLDIDLIHDVKEHSIDRPDGFGDLVLPEDHKEIVKALVKTHARGSVLTSDTTKEERSTSRDIDVVKGKGQGLVILLHGVPGVGKTSTAECVAAHTNRPLFPITCGDVGGSTAKDVEDNLESYFYLARRWGCVLLLDEADVFLGERLRGDIVQNSFVSVFLRVLEYYSGILILTTNRVGQFDEAIKSRLHLSLYYPPLTKKDSLNIWKMNLDRLDREAKHKGAHEKILFSRKEILRFAKAHWASHEANRSNWNGRQIKNAFQTAIALAEWDRLNSRSMYGPGEENYGPLPRRLKFVNVSPTLGLQTPTSNV